MRRIILGVGAQKAATTWLYSQISKDPAFSAPFAKEMHVLDLAFIDAFGAERKQVEDRARKVDAASSLQCDDPKSVHRFSMIENVRDISITTMRSLAKLKDYRAILHRAMPRYLSMCCVGSTRVSGRDRLNHELSLLCENRSRALKAQPKWL